MAIQDDFSIAQNGSITYTGSTANYTVIAFHRWLQDLADDAVASDTSGDLLDITDSTPSDRSTDNIITLINGYSIDDTTAQHLYDGSIIQNDGDDIYDGLVVIAAAGCELEVIQNGAKVTNFWGTSYNADAANGISHKFMVKVRASGTDTDGRRLICQTRGWGKTYSEFRINGTARGNNVAALTYADDLNNTTTITAIAAIADISNLTEGYASLDVDNNSTPENYYSEWDRGANSINTFYEYAKWLTRAGSASTMYGLNGELFRGITHQIAYSSLAGGTFSDSTSITFSNGATAQILADNGSSTMWVQLLTGNAPVATDTCTQSAVTATVSTVTERSVPTPFVGQSTGSSLIGGYGVGLQITDLTASDKLFDLTNTQRTPPNYVTFSVGGLVSAEDFVLVGPATGAALNTAQFTLAATLNAANVTAVQINTTIPSDTPASGTIRVADNNGVFRRLVYTSYTGDTFTVDPTASEAYDGTTTGVADFDSTGATLGNSVFISYIDKLATAATESFTGVYASDRNLYIRVRDGKATPIKTFETTGVLSSGGGSTTAIRNSDA